MEKAKKKKLEKKPLGSAPGPPPTPTPVAAPSPAPATPEAVEEAPWVKVGKKGRKPDILTAEAIKNSDDPVTLLLTRKKGEVASTVEILVTHAVIPLSIKAQSRPFLAWRHLLKRATGFTPLNIVLIHPRKAIIYWDATSSHVKTKILDILDNLGYFRFPAEEGAISDHHFLRAYKSGYFKLLRQAALVGLSPQSKQWVLDKAQGFWQKSEDKVRRHIWLRRIAWDKKELADGVEVAAGVLPNLDPNYKKRGVITPLDMTPRVSCLKWIGEYIYLRREQKAVWDQKIRAAEAARVEKAEAAQAEAAEAAQAEEPETSSPTGGGVAMVME